MIVYTTGEQKTKRYRPQNRRLISPPLKCEALRRYLVRVVFSSSGLQTIELAFFAFSRRILTSGLPLAVRHSQETRYGSLDGGSAVCGRKFFTPLELLEDAVVRETIWPCRATECYSALPHGRRQRAFPQPYGRYGRSTLPGLIREFLRRSVRFRAFFFLQGPREPEQHPALITPIPSARRRPMTKFPSAGCLDRTTTSRRKILCVCPHTTAHSR
jgi:hypothetical protein